MEYEYWMATLYKIDSNRRRQACALAGGARAIFQSPPERLKRLHLFTDEEVLYICENRKSFDLQSRWKELEVKKILFLPFSHKDYPEKLRQIYDPPFALYVKGRVPDPQKKSVAIVGARACSEYGRSVAQLLGRTLAQYDVQVISGMAIGIDSASHAGALSTGGDTFAVLGNGCDICYPRSAGNIYRNILSGHGGILSEVAPGTKPLPYFFPLRNRIISSLSDVVVVVEAKERSGSLITADCALEQGKDIYAVPGRYMDTLSFGCNRLIEQGAAILYDMENFLNSLNIAVQKKNLKSNSDKMPLEKEEKLVYGCLDLSPKFINSIINETDLNLLTVLQAINSLKKKQLVQETFQNYFCRKL